MKALFSMSQIDRVMQCIGSLVIPKGVRSEQANVWSEQGTRKHSALEAASLGARWEDIRARAPADMSDAELKTFLDAWLEIRRGYQLAPIPDFPLSEVTLVYNALTGTGSVLGAGLGRRYEVDRGEIPGTGDFFFYRDSPDGQRPAYLDLKTGNPAKAKQPVDAWQNKAMAVALNRVLGTQGVWTGLWYPREGLKVRWAWCSETMLQRWEGELKTRYELAESVTNGETEGEVVKGKECFFCDSRPNCPLFQKVVPDAT